MPISVACPTCGSKLKAPDQLAGRTVKCPKCGDMLAVPAPPEPPDVPVVEAEEPRAAQPAARRPVLPSQREDAGPSPTRGTAGPKAGRKVPRWAWYAGVPTLFIVMCCGVGSCVSARRAGDLADADKLFADGNKAGAVAKYKELYPFPGDRKVEMLQRIVDTEAEAGNAAEAERWAQKALQDGAEVDYQTPAAKALAVRVKRQNDERVAKEKADREAKARAREAERDAQAKARADEARAREEAVPLVEAPKLWSEYNANEVAADRSYKGKEVRVAGKVTSVGKDVLGSMYVSLDGGGLLHTVQCFFPSKAAATLAELSPGQEVTIRGKVSGRVLTGVVVKDCSLTR